MRRKVADLKKCLATAQRVLSTAHEELLDAMSEDLAKFAEKYADTSESVIDSRAYDRQLGDGSWLSPPSVYFAMNGQHYFLDLVKAKSS
jgi:hypothetical protein